MRNCSGGKRAWELHHLSGAALREGAAGTPRGAFPIYKAPRTSPLSCRAHSAKLLGIFHHEQFICKILTLCLFTRRWLMAGCLLLWFPLQQTAHRRRWEFLLLWAEHGSCDLAQWEMRVPKKAGVPGKENS